MDNHFVWKKVNPSKYDLVKKTQMSQDDEFELYNEKDKSYSLKIIKNVCRACHQADHFIIWAHGLTLCQSNQS